MRKNRARAQCGFTLVEVLAVLIIVAILAAVGTPIYFKYVEGARSADAQTTIGAIHTANKVHRQRHGVYTNDLKKLNVQIDEATERAWKFKVEASPTEVKSIEAVSTADMPGGAGKKVTFTPKTGKFEGYGLDE